MLKDLFNLRHEVFNRNRTEPASETPGRAEVPAGLWAKCNGCGRPLYAKMLDTNYKVCPMCDYHFRLTPAERIAVTFDEGSFERLEFELPPSNPLDFPGYAEKLEESRAATGEREAVVCGVGRIGGIRTACCIMNSFFMMGSMGYVLGESVTRTVEYAAEHRLPLVIFTCSGGARMQEGIVSLMQMAKISGALQRYGEAGLFYLTVITNPTTGGVSASFASLGDVILAEKGALIGFAGKRVIEQTIKQKLPRDFQTAEFALEHGLIDGVVMRAELKPLIARLLALHAAPERMEKHG